MCSRLVNCYFSYSHYHVKKKVVMASSLKKTALSVFNRKGHNSSAEGSQETPLTPKMSGKRRRDAVSESSSSGDDKASAGASKRENASPVRPLQACDVSVENDHSCLHKVLLGQSKLMDRLDSMATRLSLLTTENAALRERLPRVEKETKTNKVWATKRLDAAQKQTEHIRNNFSGELKDMKST